MRPTPSILLVDDNEIVCKILRSLIEDIGTVEVRCALDGADAIAEIQNDPPDLLITDWSMGAVSGADCLAFVRTSPDSPNRFMPVVVLSGHDDSARWAALSLGADAFLLKPAKARDVHHCIVSLLTQPRGYVHGATYLGPVNEANPAGRAEMVWLPPIVEGALVAQMEPPRADWAQGD